MAPCSAAKISLGSRKLQCKRSSSQDRGHKEERFPIHFCQNPTKGHLSKGGPLQGGPTSSLPLSLSPHVAATAFPNTTSPNTASGISEPHSDLPFPIQKFPIPSKTPTPPIHRLRLSNEGPFPGGREIFQLGSAPPSPLPFLLHRYQGTCEYIRRLRGREGSHTLGFPSARRILPSNPQIRMCQTPSSRSAESRTEYSTGNTPAPTICRCWCSLGHWAESSPHILSLTPGPVILAI
jgi:hypothetical protein